MRIGELRELQQRLGHDFANPDLLARALTHASAVAGGSGEAGATYERLEFLGDRVLGLVVADMLDEYLPTAPEGELSRRINRLVSGDACAAVAREIELQKYMRMSGGRATASMLGDVCEAVLGAVYRDGGLPAARAVIERFWRARLETMSGPSRDAKTELQEWAHRRGFETPLYSQILRSGPDHAPEFEIEVSVGTLSPGRGRGRSKREAEFDAAANVLRRESVWSPA
ncbi:MAG: ribonuclease III [Rhizobiales bacterium]|nr:ribonuclease III [Hyphomicrobiales bacterium]